MEGAAEPLVIVFATPDEWENWLKEHQTEIGGVWVKMAKKATGIASISQAEAIEVALCYGWIDGQSASFDEQYWLQKFTPRRARSIWSQVNCEKVTRLIEQGRMQPAGMRQVELAKADGRWDRAYAPSSKATVPDDLQSELDKNPAAQAFFNTLNSSNRYAILHRIMITKRAETRAATIRKFVAMLSKGEKLHP